MAKKPTLAKPKGALAMCSCPQSEVSTRLGELNNPDWPLGTPARDRVWKQDTTTRRSNICAKQGLALLYAVEKYPPKKAAKKKPAKKPAPELNKPAPEPNKPEMHGGAKKTETTNPGLTPTTKKTDTK